MTEKELNIRLSSKEPTMAQITSTYEDGSIKKRWVSMSSLMKQFEMTEHRFSAEKTPLMFLPPSVKFFQMYAGTSTHYTVGIVMPAGKRRFNYFDKETMVVPFPALLFVFEVRDTFPAAKKCFALDSDELTEESVLYVYPFGNVESSSGNICYGSNVLPPVNGVKDLEKLVEIFVGSTTNNDYWSTQAMLSKEAYPLGTQLGLLEDLKERDSFPRDYLKPSVVQLANFSAK